MHIRNPDLSRADESNRRFWGGIAFGTLGMLAFSGTLPATRVAVPSLGPTIITLGRIEIAALFSVVTLMILRAPVPGRRHWFALLVMGLGLAIGYPFFLALALKDIPSAHASVVIGLAPGATATLAVLRAGEQPPPVFWIACLIGFLAIALFAIHEGGGAIVPADGWLVVAILCVAVSYVEGGKVSRELGATVALCWAMILLAPLVAIPFVLAVWTHDWTVTVTNAAWAGFAYAGVVSMFLGSVAWYQGLALGGIARIGQLNLATPLFALLWSHLLLGEPIGWAALVCAVVVGAAMLICVRSRSGDTTPSKAGPP